MIRRPPRSTLFPSPTLFRSSPAISFPTPAVASAPPSAPATVASATTAAIAPILRLPADPSAGAAFASAPTRSRSEEHTSELQSRSDLVCRLLLEKKKKTPADCCMYSKRNVRAYSLAMQACSVRLGESRTLPSIGAEKSAPDSPLAVVQTYTGRID